MDSLWRTSIKFHFLVCSRIKFDFDPSPEIPMMDKPTKLLVLDGASLTPADLVRCEKGECIIQVGI